MLRILTRTSTLSIPATVNSGRRSSSEIRKYAEYGTIWRVCILLVALSRTGNTGLSITPLQCGQGIVWLENLAPIVLPQCGQDSVQNNPDAIGLFPCAALG